MDRRRAAGALLALAACIASATAAPTASNQTALDLYDESTEGCYYNFQHYGEGDRIMTNEPCLNCTCHNRMLMCYLRVCPFTKAIGQDCTVEKRADQCCPIVTCPDVPVDLLTSTSTSSPAEYGGTGVGKVDKYGCSINGKYFPEGAKVPPAPGKPCEHCYCIRNMTTCVMQECTLHVDGCTPIYHKDVCCPVRYFCDHPEDEMPLLDDMTTTVRPTPGFLLTTTAPTEEYTTTMQPVKRDCIEDDQLYPDGALIKTDKPCEHCYCMKGDIVCVVQECGTPMENEGKNCTSLPPREGHCCPDTYICEGDEMSTEIPTTEISLDESVTTLVPPRRVSVEGSGYRIDDEIPYTEVPTFATELEGSGEDEIIDKPGKETSEKDHPETNAPTEEAEFIPLTTQASIAEKTEKASTEPDKGINTVPSGVLEDGSTETSQREQTTPKVMIIDSEQAIRQDEQSTTARTEEEKSSELPSATETAPSKATEPSILDEQSTESTISLEKETHEPSPVKYTTPKKEDEITGLPITESSIVSEPGVDITVKPIEDITEISLAEKSSTEAAVSTKSPFLSEKDRDSQIDMDISTTSGDDTKTTVIPLKDKEVDIPISDTRRTTPDIAFGTTSKPIAQEEITEPTVLENITPLDREHTTEPLISEQNTIPISDKEGQTTEAAVPEKPFIGDKPTTTKLPGTEDETISSSKPLESSEPTAADVTTTSDIETSKMPTDVSTEKSTTVITKEDELAFTTEPTFRKEEDSVSPIEIVTDKYSELPTTIPEHIVKETTEPSEKTTSLGETTSRKPEESEVKLTTAPVQQEEKEVTTESVMELSTFAHVDEKEPASDIATIPPAFTEKIDLPHTTSINAADNEIAEVPFPGRIPGEGDCLLEGTTYQNESIVPSTNKCHSGCKCVSSIIKCDPIICSPPPEGMDNCQPRYDTPEACCPTYVCDHGMETIPPQPQSHITGTESPLPPTIECHGDVCEKTSEDQLPVKPPTTPQNIDTGDCGISGCDQTVQQPAEPCSDNKCETFQPPTEFESEACGKQGGCVIKPETITPPEIPQVCTSDECKQAIVPQLETVPCEGPSCTSVKEECRTDECKQAIIPQLETVPCVGPSCTSVKDECSTDECKQAIIPQLESGPCEGPACSSVVEECRTGECKVDLPPHQRPSEQGAICSEDNGCKKPEKDSECEHGKCGQKEVDRVGTCSGDDCMQQQPISPTQEIEPIGSMSTEIPVAVKETSIKPVHDKEMHPATSESTTTLSESTVTDIPTIFGEPEKEITESPPDKEDRLTKVPEEFDSSPIPEITSTQSVNELDQKITEVSTEEGTIANEPITKAPVEYTTATIKTYDTIKTEIPVTEISPEIKPTEEKTKQPMGVTDSYNIITDTLEETTDKEREKATEIPREQYDETKSTAKPESSITEEGGTKTPVGVKDGQEHITLGPESFATKADNDISPLEGEPTKLSTEPPLHETVTEETVLSEETTKQPETSETKTEEPPVQVTEISEEKIEGTTKYPVLQEEDTATPTKETTSAEVVQPDKHTTLEPQEPKPQESSTKVPKEDTEKVTEHAGVEEESESTTGISDVTQSSIMGETKLPDTDEFIPTKNILREQEMSETTSVSPVQVEIATSTVQAELDVGGIDEKEKITSMPETTIFKEDTETESPLSYSTKPANLDSFTTVTAESNEIPKLSSSKPQTEEEVIITPAPEIYHETVRPTDYEETESSLRPTTEEAQAVESITGQDIITKVPLPAVTEATEAEVVTLTSLEPITVVLPETQTQETLGITSSNTSQPPMVGEAEVDSQKPTSSEEFDISTKEPEKTEKEEQHTVKPEYEKETTTKEPEVYATEPIRVEKPIEKPAQDVEKEVTKARPSIETVQPEFVTESLEEPEDLPEKNVTTESPVFEQESVETPEPHLHTSTLEEEHIPTVTPQTTEPYLHVSTLEEHIPTVTSQEVDVGPQKLSTGIPLEDDLQTKLPEPHDDRRTETEELPVTIIPDHPVQDKTESIEAQKTTATPLSHEPSEITTFTPKLQEVEHDEKQTEQPISLFTEEKPTSDIIGEEQDNNNDQKPTEILPEEPVQTSRPEVEHSETTPYLVELEEHTHKIDEEATVTLSDTPTVAPSNEPTEVTTNEPAGIPSDELAIPTSKEPTVAPSDELTVAPSGEPTSTTSDKPTVPTSDESVPAHSDEPAVATAEESLVVPTDEPIAPSVEPNVAPSGETAVPPSDKPAATPSDEPTATPYSEPTVAPSDVPTMEHSVKPTAAPSNELTTVYLGEPTVSPSGEPTITPSDELLSVTSKEPTPEISDDHTKKPSEETADTPPETSTITPTEEKTVVPTEGPEVPLSEGPTIPSEEPSVALPEETISPTGVPLEKSTDTPSAGPTTVPSVEYTVPSTAVPTGTLLGETTSGLPEERTTFKTEQQPIDTTTKQFSSEENQTEPSEIEIHKPSDQKEEAPLTTNEIYTTVLSEEVPERSTEPVVVKEYTSEMAIPTDNLVDKYGGAEEDIEKSTTPKSIEDVMTSAPSIETEKPASTEEPHKDITVKPHHVPVETTAPEEEFIPVTKATTAKAEEEALTESPQSKPEEKPSELPTAAPEVPKPDEIQPIDEVPSPEDESHFPPSGGYQEPDYVEEDQAFGPGTCRYGGKVYVSAQQIPRDDPCDFCFCFRSDIICLQQSCPPPIQGCHEEPIQGFCCPRYECPVSMATTLNVTTTTTTTTTTLPPHFLPHAYKGAATRKGCQIKGHTYQVGEVVRASSGPCLHCTCGGDGQMKCDPKQCTPEPMLRQMIAAAVSAKRRR